MWENDSISEEGEIYEVLSERTWMVRMKNGYEVLAFRYSEDPSPALGDRVLLQFNPYEMSRARVVKLLE